MLRVRTSGAEVVCQLQQSVNVVEESSKQGGSLAWPAVLCASLWGEITIVTHILSSLRPEARTALAHGIRDGLHRGIEVVTATVAAFDPRFHLQHAKPSC